MLTAVKQREGDRSGAATPGRRSFVLALACLVLSGCVGTGSSGEEAASPPSAPADGPQLSPDELLTACVSRAGFSVEVEGETPAGHEEQLDLCSEEVAAALPEEGAYDSLSPLQQQEADEIFNSTLENCLAEDGFIKGDNWDYAGGGNTGVVVHPDDAVPPGFDERWVECGPIIDEAVAEFVRANT